MADIFGILESPATHWCQNVALTLQLFMHRRIYSLMVWLAVAVVERRFGMSVSVGKNHCGSDIIKIPKSGWNSFINPIYRYTVKSNLKSTKMSKNCPRHSLFTRKTRWTNRERHNWAPGSVAKSSQPNSSENIDQLLELNYRSGEDYAGVPSPHAHRD